MKILLRKISNDLVYRISGGQCVSVPDAVLYDFRIVPIHSLEKSDWRRIWELQGRFSSIYLRLAYANKRTSVAMIYIDGELASLLWVVPQESIRGRYPFVDKSSSAIISCVTASAFRGKGLYPLGIRLIALSGHSNAYFIWAHVENTASLRGIEKAGAQMIGAFERTVWFRGLLSRLRFTPYRLQE